MKISMLIAMSAVMISFSAWADFGGKWLGKGEFSADGGKMICESASLEVAQMSGRLDIKDIQVKCVGNVVDVDPQSYDINGSDLYNRSGKVGTINPTTIHMDYSPEPGYQLLFDGTIKDNNLSFKGKVVDIDAGKTYEFQGDLARK